MKQVYYNQKFPYGYVGDVSITDYFQMMQFSQYILKL